MRISIQWAMTKDDSGFRPCELCEAEFAPRPVLVLIDPYGFEICGECARAILERKRRGDVQADWPTWEQYQEALREHSEPMMSKEDLRSAEELGLYDDFYALAQLSD